MADGSGFTFNGEPIELTRLALRPGDVLAVRLREDKFTADQLRVMGEWLTEFLRGGGLSNEVVVLPPCDLTAVEAAQLDDRALAKRVMDLKKRGLIRL